MSSGGEASLGFRASQASPGFFAWVIPALRTKRTLKTWVRSVVALAATLVLMVATKSLNNMGQAAFFAAIVAVFLPPSLALSLFLLACFTLLLGMVIGWAWGCAAMAAGLAVRNQSLLAHQQQQLQASLVQGVPRDYQVREFTFKGGFLDPRVSAVYGAFFFIGTFAFGAMRAYIPKLTLLSIFGSIVLDIMCSYGPLFPKQQYTLAKVFLIPTAYYVAIAIVTLIFIFPESLNHVWLTTIQTGLLKPISQILSTQSQALNSDPTDKKKWEELAGVSYTERQELLIGGKEILEQIGLIDLEFSIGRLGPGDVKRVGKELRLLAFKAAGLYAFPIYVRNIHASLAEQANQEPQPQAQRPQQQQQQEIAEDDEVLSPPTPAFSQFSINKRSSVSKDRYSLLQEQFHAYELEHNHDLDSLLPILSASSVELRGACELAMHAVSAWFHSCNSGRWRGFFSAVDKKKNEERKEELVRHLEKVEKALERFRKVERVKLVKPFERFFDEETGRQFRGEKGQVFTVRSLLVCFVFSFTIDAFAERLAKFLTTLIDIDSRRPKPRLWAPSGFGKVGRKLMSRKPVDKRVAPLSSASSKDLTAFNHYDADESEDEESNSERDIQRARKNPDALPPKTFIGRFFVRLGAVVRFLKSPEGVFSLRHAVVSVALWVPAVVHSSAWFYYGNKGIWALIMAQTALATYAGDQIASFVLRITGTVLGLLLGMAIWYIGAPGQESGNPYGIVIATTALVSPFLLGRIAAPVVQLQIWAMAGLTMILVVGYSWVDTHLPVLVSAGVGIAVGWKRALLVIIGFTAAFIIMMFPRPTSARTLVRHTLAATASELGHILAVEVDALLAEEDRASMGLGNEDEEKSEAGRSSQDDGSEKPSRKEMRVRRIAQRVFVVATRLQDLDSPLVTARFEPQVQGLWPHEKYERLHDIQVKLLSALLLFTGGFMQLDAKWCTILVHQTPLLNPNLLSDVFSNISIVAYALGGGHPLPPSLPKLQDRLVYHERLAAHALQDSRPTAVGASSFDPDDIGDRMGFKEMTLPVLKDDQLPAHSSAIFALSNAISLVDEMTEIVRDLVGEVKFEGIDNLHEKYLGQEEKTLGGGFAQRMRFR